MPVVLRCQNCRSERRYQDERMLAELHTRGMLRREAKPQLDLVRELFASIALQMACQDCGHVGVSVEDDWQDDWSDEQRCVGCDAVIPEERLEIFPGTTRCATCQARHETGEDIHQQNDYCPHCGGILELKPRTATGLARYRQVCSSCRRTV